GYSAVVSALFCGHLVLYGNVSIVHTYFEHGHQMVYENIIDMIEYTQHKRRGFSNDNDASKYILGHRVPSREGRWSHSNNLGTKLEMMTTLVPVGVLLCHHNLVNTCLHK